MTDTSTLNQIHEVNGEDALVDAGVSWLELVQAAAPLNLSPPTLTDYLGLRVGGTLSVGGIGGQAALSGLQVDNALELEVVTGRGDRLTFSRRRRPVLFRAVLAGLGQCAVIVRARLRLRPVPPRVRTYTARTATSTPSRPIRSGSWRRNASTTFFLLEAARYFEAGDEPDDAVQLPECEDRERRVLPGCLRSGGRDRRALPRPGDQRGDSTDRGRAARRRRPGGARAAPAPMSRCPSWIPEC